MSTNWFKYMSETSDEDVQEYIRDHRHYVTEAVEAAILESNKRGTVIPQEKADEILALSRERDRREQDEAGYLESFFSGSWKRYQTNNPSAPLFYSQRAIQIFSVLFSPLFGAFMLAANIERTKERKGFWVAGIFGFLYPVIVVLLLREIEIRNFFVTFTMNYIGALIITLYFWPQFLGKSTKYQPRAVIYPMMFGLVLLIIAGLVAIYLK